MSEEELDALVEKAKKKNLRLGVTGMLVYYDGSFIQILEGAEDVINDLFQTIKKDRRHDNVIIIDAEYIEHRSFSSWQMALKKLSLNDLIKYPELKSLLNLSDSKKNATLSQLVKVFLNLTVCRK